MYAQPAVGPAGPWRFISGNTDNRMVNLGWNSMGLLELTALPSLEKERHPSYRHVLCLHADQVWTTSTTSRLRLPHGRWERARVMRTSSALNCRPMFMEPSYGGDAQRTMTSELRQ